MKLNDEAYGFDLNVLHFPYFYLIFFCCMQKTIQYHTSEIYSLL